MRAETLIEAPSGLTGFGDDVALDGDWMVVGGHPTVQVYRHDGTDWVLDQTLAPFGSFVSSFGDAVAISGNVVVVGATGDYDSEGSDPGAAYVYRHDGASWVAEQKLTATGVTDTNAFGVDVAVDGDVIAVGAIYDNPGGIAEAGSAYAYRHDGASWNEEQKLVASDASVSSWFGRGLAVEGDTLVVGASLDGSAYVFRHDGASWNEEQKLVPSDAFSAYDTSLEVSGDTILFGGGDAGPGGLTHAGAVYVFEFDGLAWGEEQRLTPADAVAHQRFGITVALAGDLLAVGELGAAGQRRIGPSFFLKTGGSWKEQAKIVNQSAGPADALGWRVALSGTHLAVATQSSSGGGRVRIFRQSVGCDGGDCFLDVPADAKKLLLRQTSTGGALDLVFPKGSGSPFPSIGTDVDPANGTPGGLTLELFSAGEGTASLAVPAGESSQAPGWVVESGRSPRYRFRSRQGPIEMRSVALRPAGIASFKARSSGLPLAGAQGEVGVRITFGTLRTCALFDAATVQRDGPGLFLAKGAVASSLDDCTGASMP